MPWTRMSPPQRGWFRQQLAQHDRRHSASRLAYQARLLEPHVHRHSTLLDVGCGSGLLGIHLRDSSGCRVIGMDIADTRSAEIEFLLFDGEAFPLPSASVDYVVLSFVLHHSPEPTFLCTEALRVARRGVFIFEDIPSTVAQRFLLATHIIFFSWLYRLSWPTKRPWETPHLDCLRFLAASCHTRTFSMAASAFKGVYPVSRRFYAFRSFGSADRPA